MGQPLCDTWTLRVQANQHSANEPLFTSEPLIPILEIAPVALCPFIWILNMAIRADQLSPYVSGRDARPDAT